MIALMPDFLSFPAAVDWNLDIDRYLNKLIPPCPSRKFPHAVRRFLGYREEPVRDVGNVLIAFWALLGTFTGLLVVSALFRFTPWIEAHSPPVLIASLGAAAVLEYSAIASPLAQPRNALSGHAISAFVGIAVAKAFNSHANFEDIRWLASPLACGLASAAMTLTNTVHPPGGATAVLAIIDPALHAMGWLFLPLIIIACLLMISVALIFNNIQRRYPIYWWTPLEVGQIWKRKSKHTQKVMDVEGFNVSNSQTLSGSVKTVESNKYSLEESIILAPNGLLSIPTDTELDERERAFLEKLLAKLQAPRLRSHPHQTEKSWLEPPHL